MERKLKLKYKDGEPVADREITLLRKGQRVETRTDGGGRCEFEWRHDWVDQLQVDQVVIKRDWDLSGGWGGPSSDLGEIVIARPGESSDSSRERRLDDAPDQGVRGMLFYADGTLAHQTFRVEVEFDDADGKRWSTENKPSYSKDNGEFFIATDSYRRGARVSRVYVDGDLIPKGGFFKTKGGDYVVIVPKGMGRGGGTRGGLITGRVLDPDGAAAFGAKVTAEVKNNSWLPLGNEHATAHADKKGRFVLTFTGGTVLKKLYADGSEPASMAVGKGPQQSEVPNRDISAGTFGIAVTRKKKAFFGLF